MKDLNTNIRNFCIIAHIDHGKSTLADRFLEITKTIPKKQLTPQFLDQLEAEQEHGVTIKMQPVRMKWKNYFLNLIDTPGHIDFSYEVSRALKSVEGAILLIDATKGIQAQTISVLESAKSLGLSIIPAINKIDLRPNGLGKVASEIRKLLGKDKDISFISAKKGRGVRELLLRVIQEIPPPKKNLKDTLKALVFDANYDPHRGIIAYIRIFDGVLKKGEKIYLIGAKTQSKAQEIGIFAPGLQPKNELNAGEIGYVVTNVKEPNKVLIGDILTHSPTLSPNFSVCTGFKKPQPKVFASIYPEKETDFSKLAQSLSILSLSDSAFQFRPESSSLFNNGFLIGALGNFHLQIIQERLEKEFNLATVLTLPIVSYKFLLNDKKKINSSTIEKIDFSKVKKVYEPKAKIKIITPLKYQGKITDFLFQKEAEFLGSDFLEESQRIILEFKLPLLQVMRGLYNKILSLSSGFASMDYEFLGYEDEDLVKVDIYVAEKIFAPLSFLNKRKNAYKEAKNRVEKIKKFLPRQLFELDIKAKIGTKVIAKARIPALRKDVLAKLYGGDRTRKDKLLKKQKIGKKRMKKIGQLSLPSDFFLKISQI